VYPDARLIYIVRDGRDTAISHRIQTFVEFPEQLSKEDLRIRSAFTQDSKPFLCGERSIFTETAIQRAAEGWRRNVEETHQLGQELYGERYLALRFEDLLADPWREMERVWEFLGAASASPGLRESLAEEMRRNPDADWQQQKASQIAAYLQKGKPGSWREMLTARDREVFHRTCGETLKQWGYEPTVT
jgi:hypothetical protein